VASHPGLVAAVGNEALAAGGKRLRPLLVFFSTPPGRSRRLRPASRSSSHMATLVTTT
jgi:geranylgeranyl pyrophosphate synthase